MNTSRIRYLALVFALMVCSCSVEVNQTIEPPQLTPTVSVSTTSSLSVTQVPVTWAHLNLRGKLVYTTSREENGGLTNNIQSLDLRTGETGTIFSASPGAWIYYATISPDGKSMILSYVPPAQSNSPSNRSLYLLPMDSLGEPQLLTPPTPDEHYTQAEWSPDGTYIYYVQYNSKIRHPGQLDPVYNLYRMRYPDGPPEQLTESAFWMRPSSDSSRLVYVFVDPETARNDLFVANADGGNSQRVGLTGPEIPEIIDAPIFLPDGQSILFSAPEPVQSYQPNFFERLMGIQVVKAHDVPSDWWSVPVTGGEPTRLTQLNTINLYASISPDQQHIASVSGDGIFVMELDGSNLTQLVSDPGVHGTVSWIP